MTTEATPKKSEKHALAPATIAARERREQAQGIAVDILAIANGVDSRAKELASEIFDCANPFTSPDSLRDCIRDAVQAEMGDEYPKARTQAYYNITNAIVSVVHHYGEMVAGRVEDGEIVESWSAKARKKTAWETIAESKFDRLCRERPDVAAKLIAAKLREYEAVDNLFRKLTDIPTSQEPETVEEQVA